MSIMRIFRFFSWKAMIVAIPLLIIIGCIPDSLYSQSAPEAFSTHTYTANVEMNEFSKGGSGATRSVTSIRPKPISQPASNSTQKVVVDKLDMPDAQRPSLITQSVLLAALSLLPFAIMILSSFLKIVVVLSLLRSALGVQQAPPNQVINGVAFLLSLFIMYPTGAKMYQAASETVKEQKVPDSLLSPDSSTYVIAVAQAAGEPMRDFLKRNSSPRHQALFYRLMYRGLSEEFRSSLKTDDFIVLVPSYITGQLKDAFEIGVLIYIPFFVIDLVTSNILLAMGMMMLSPVTISMPLKLFLLVMLDGWTILIDGLVKTFQ